MPDWAIHMLESVTTPIGGATGIWLLGRIKPIRRWFFDYTDDLGRMVRVPPWRFASVVGALAGASVAVALWLLLATSGSSIPMNAVVAFDGKCPVGWSDVGDQEPERFAGRMIVAVGPMVDRGGTQTTLKRALNDQGGTERHKLSVSELPKHNFTTTFNVVTFSSVDKYNAGGKNYFAVGSQPTTVTTNTIGEDASFETISPFIALYYCRKN